MRTISPALLAHLQGHTLTVATLLQITRQDGQVFGFTDHDTDIVFNGLRYDSSIGYTPSTIESNSDLTTSNLELDALLDSPTIQLQDLEAGLWDNANVTFMLVNYADLTMGSVTLTSGKLGQPTMSLGRFVAELRSVAQIMQQPIGEVFRRCAVRRSANADAKWTWSIDANERARDLDRERDDVRRVVADATGPIIAFMDTVGQKIPTVTPWQIRVVPPTGGAFVSNTSVRDAGGNVWAWSDRVQVRIDMRSTRAACTRSAARTTRVTRFFSTTTTALAISLGKVTFTSGANAGYSQEVRAFAPGFVTLAMPMPFPIALGDQFTIVAGCDRTAQTCKTRFNNLVNFAASRLYRASTRSYEHKVRES